MHWLGNDYQSHWLRWRRPRPSVKVRRTHRFPVKHLLKVGPDFVLTWSAAVVRAVSPFFPLLWISQNSHKLCLLSVRACQHQRPPQPAVVRPPQPARSGHQFYLQLYVFGKICVKWLNYIIMLFNLPVGPSWLSSVQMCRKEHPGMMGHPQCSHPASSRYSRSRFL